MHIKVYIHMYIYIGSLPRASRLESASSCRNLNLHPAGERYGDHLSRSLGLALHLRLVVDGPFANVELAVLSFRDTVDKSVLRLYLLLHVVGCGGLDLLSTVPLAVVAPSFPLFGLGSPGDLLDLPRCLRAFVAISDQAAGGLR